MPSVILQAGSPSHWYVKMVESRGSVLSSNTAALLFKVVVWSNLTSLIQVRTQNQKSIMILMNLHPKYLT